MNTTENNSASFQNKILSFFNDKRRVLGFSISVAFGVCSIGLLTSQKTVILIGALSVVIEIAIILILAEEYLLHHPLVSITLLLLILTPYLAGLSNIQKIPTSLLDQTIEYQGRLISIEYLKGFLGLTITDTRLWFADGQNFTISGQHDYLLSLNYSVYYHIHLEYGHKTLYPSLFPVLPAFSFGYTDNSVNLLNVTGVG